MNASPAAPTCRTALRAPPVALPPPAPTEAVALSQLERRTASALAALGLTAEPQVAIGAYRVDFLVRAQALVVEADSCFWHGCAWCGLEPAQRTVAAEDAYQARRDRALWHRYGLAVVHAPGHALDTVEAATETLRRALERLGVRVPPPPMCSNTE